MFPLIPVYIKRCSFSLSGMAALCVGGYVWMTETSAFSEYLNLSCYRFHVRKWAKRCQSVTFPQLRAAIPAISFSCTDGFNDWMKTRVSVGMTKMIVQNIFSTLKKIKRSGHTYQLQITSLVVFHLYFPRLHVVHLAVKENWKTVKCFLFPMPFFKVNII